MLRHAADYRRFAGRLARIVTTTPLDGQSAFSGRIVAVEREHGGDPKGEPPRDIVVLEEGRKTHRVPVASIKRGRLAVEFK